MSFMRNISFYDIREEDYSLKTASLQAAKIQHLSGFGKCICAYCLKRQGKAEIWQTEKPPRLQQKQTNPKQFLSAWD